MDGGLFFGAAKGMSPDVPPSRPIDIDQELWPTVNGDEYSQEQK